MQAKWFVCIDWNDDGDFSDPSEDVTPDVLGLAPGALPRPRVRVHGVGPARPGAQERHPQV